MLILYMLLSILGLFFISERWQVLAGFTVATLYSVVRFVLLEYTFASLLSNDGKNLPVGRTVFTTAGSYLVLIGIIIVSIKAGIWVFAGTVSGFLLTPAVIVVNGITEALGITRNNFK